MRVTIPIIVLLSLAMNGRAQTESVHLHFDKVVAYPGDTVWFSAYVFDNNVLSNYSKNLYVELYDEDNKLVLRKLYPIDKGLSMGQLELPKKTGLFWIRGYTRNSSFFLQSLTIRGIDNTVIVRKLLDFKASPATTEIPGLLINSSYTENGISCTIFPQDNAIYNGQAFHLVAMYYNTKIADYSFTVNQNHQQNITISKDSLQGYVHGYVSLLFYQADTLVARQDLFIPQREVPVELDKDGEGYVFRIKDTADWSYSISVVNAAWIGYFRNIQHSLSIPGKRRPSDTSYLTYKASVSSKREFRNLLNEQELVMSLGTDSISHIKLVPIDHLGNLELSNLFFFGISSLYYTLNGYIGDKVKDVRLKLYPDIYPEFFPPDSLDYETKTLSSPPSFSDASLDIYQYLKPVFVESDFKKGLDARYTSAHFSGPVHYSFDLVHANKFNYSILDFLSLELPYFGSNSWGRTPPSFKGKPVIIYLDEQVINWRELFNVHIQELAYVKVIEDLVDIDPYVQSVSEIDAGRLPTLKDPFGSDNTPSAMLCLYTRKNRDLRSTQSNLQISSIRGYDKPIQWSCSDRTTLLWTVYNHVQNFKFTLPTRNTSCFSIIVDGVSKSGRMFHHEELLPSTPLSNVQK